MNTTQKADYSLPFIGIGIYGVVFIVFVFVLRDAALPHVILSSLFGTNNFESAIVAVSCFISSLSTILMLNFPEIFCSKKIGCAVVTTLIAMAGFLGWYYWKQTIFDSKKWSETDYFKDARRFMVDDLLKNHRLQRMKFDEVEFLLGKTDLTHFHQYDCVYSLDTALRGTSTDSLYIGINFENNRVVKAKVFSH